MSERRSIAKNRNLIEVCWRCFLGIVFFALTVFILKGAVESAVTSLRLVVTGERTEGTVVSIEVRRLSSSRGGSPLRHPVVEFMDGDTSVRFMDNSAVWRESSDLSGTVPVVYDPERPETASVDQFWYLWSDPLKRWLVVLIFFTGAMWLLRGGWRQMRARASQTPEDSSA